MSTPATLRRWYMRTTSASVPWEGSRRFVRVLYALWAPIYDWTIAWDPAYRANAARMVEASTRAGDRVLDVGIGTGLLATLAAPRAAEYVGLDYSGTMLGRAARKMAAHRLGNVALRWGDATSLPFCDARFDAVVSSFTLAHLARSERAAALAEMRRVLRPGGRLGLFGAQGEVAPLFSTRRELEDHLREAGFGHATIIDRDDVYRIVVAGADESPG